MLKDTADNETLVTANTSSKSRKNFLAIITNTLIILATFFFLASLIQLFYMHNNILNNPKIDLKESLSGLRFDSTLSHKEILESTRLKSLLLLEAGSLQNQYYLASMVLMSRLWITYIGFVTGMTMAIMGAVFIVGKIKETSSELTARIAGHDLSLKSASPGIILSCLGACLMITAQVVNHEMSSKYNAIYIRDEQPIPLDDENGKPFLRPGIGDNIDENGKPPLSPNIGDSSANSK